MSSESFCTIEAWLRTSPNEHIRLRRHYEVVSVQTTDLMCPLGDRYPAPLGQQRRVVSLLLGLWRAAFWIARSEELLQVQARKPRLLCTWADRMVRSQDGAFWHSHHTPISRVDPSFKPDGEKGRVG